MAFGEAQGNFRYRRANYRWEFQKEWRGNGKRKRVNQSTKAAKRGRPNFDAVGNPSEGAFPLVPEYVHVSEPPNNRPEPPNTRPRDDIDIDSEDIDNSDVELESRPTFSVSQPEPHRPALVPIDPNLLTMSHRPCAATQPSRQRRPILEAPYYTDPEAFICGCHGYLISRFFCCVHLRLETKDVVDRSWLDTVVICREPPFLRRSEVAPEWTHGDYLPEGFTIPNYQPFSIPESMELDFEDRDAQIAVLAKLDRVIPRQDGLSAESHPSQPEGYSPDETPRMLESARSSNQSDEHVHDGAETDDLHFGDDGAELPENDEGDTDSGRTDDADGEDDDDDGLADAHAAFDRLMDRLLEIQRFGEDQLRKGAPPRLFNHVADELDKRVIKPIKRLRRQIPTTNGHRGHGAKSIQRRKSLAKRGIEKDLSSSMV